MSAPPVSSASADRFDTMGYALALGGAVLFSTKGIFIKLAYAHGVATETLLALRMAVALPVYAVIFLVLMRRAPGALGKLRGRTLVAIMLVGLLGYYVSSYLDFAGLQFVSAQYERLVLFTYPFFVLVLGVWFFGDRMAWSVVPGMVISYLGLAVIFGWNLVAEPQGLFAGTALVMAAALTFALYQHLAKRQMTIIGSGFFTCIGMSTAALAAIGQDAAVHGIGNLATLDGTTLGYGLALGILCTVLPSFLINTAIARIGARATSTTAGIGPVMTAVIAVIVLGEAFTPFHAVGTVLVITGITLFGRAERRALATA